MILGNIAYLSWISFVLFLMILKSDHDIDHISTIYQWWIPDTGLDKVVKIASCELEARDKQTFGDITTVNRHKSSFALIK